MVLQKEKTTVEVSGFCIAGSAYHFPCPSGSWLSRKMSSAMKIRGIVGSIFTGAHLPVALRPYLDKQNVDFFEHQGVSTTCAQLA